MPRFALCWPPNSLSNRWPRIFGVHLSPTQTQGQEAEALALRHLQGKGYTLRLKNYRTRLGEIDLILDKGKILVFVEVRERKSSSYGTPAETVTSKKQKRIAKAALMYIKEKALTNRNLRFDIVAVQNGNITHLENAFAPTGYIY